MPVRSKEKPFAALLRTLCAHPYAVLTAVYLLSVFLHGIIAFSISVIPSVMDDEMLYMQLAKALYSGEGILLRGQPIDYPYILYPLLIAPLYALPETVNLYSAIICLNTLCIHLMIFPVYALSKELTGKKGVSLLLACLTVLMPDMLLAKHIMAESIAYPLLLTILFFMYRRLRAPKGWLSGVLLGGACFLLYLLKPGYIALGAAYCAVTLIGGIREKNRALLISALWTTGTLILLVGAFTLCNRFYAASLGTELSVYAAQTGGLSLDHLWQTLVGAFKYLDFTLIAFGVLPVAAGISGIRRFQAEKRAFAWIALITLLLLLLGTAYVVYYDEWTTSACVPARVHIRYVAFLLPVFASFLYTDELSGQRLGAGLAAALCVLLTGAFAFPAASFEGSARYTVDSALLSGLLLQSGGWDGLKTYLPVFALCAAALCALTAWKGLSARVRGAFTGFLILLLCGNQIAMVQADQYAMNADLNADAAVACYLTGNDALYICAEDHTQAYETIALEVNARCAVKPVTIDALLKNTDLNGAVGDILPQGLSKHVFTSPVNAYPRPGYLIIEPALLQNLRLSDSAVPVGASKYGYYEIFALPADGQWLHSGLFGLEQNWVWTDSRFVLCDRAIRESGAMTLWLKVRAGTEGARLTLRGPDGQTFDFDPSSAAETTWIYATFTLSQTDSVCAVGLSHGGGNIYIETYAVEGARADGA